MRANSKETQQGAEPLAPLPMRVAALLIYLAQLLTAPSEVRPPVCMSRRRIEWDA